MDYHEDESTHVDLKLGHFTVLLYLLAYRREGLDDQAVGDSGNAEDYSVEVSIRLFRVGFAYA
jgi:hypothetical protein